MKKLIISTIIAATVVTAWYWFFGSPEIRFVAGRCIDHGKIYRKNQTWDKWERDSEHSYSGVSVTYTCRGNSVSKVYGLGF